MSRIVDSRQIRKPETFMMPWQISANCCSDRWEDDGKLFKYHVRYGHPGKEAWKGTVVEVHVPGHINYGITATRMTGESWGEPLRNKQLRRTTNISRRIRNIKTSGIS